MGYCVELGYVGADNCFEIAYVAPFVGGSFPQLQDPGLERPTYELLAKISDSLSDANDALPTKPDEDDLDEAADRQLRRAEIDVTINYTPRIREVGGIHLSELRGMAATEAAALLLPLIAGLGDETDPVYWKPVDGNIKRVVATILDWTFQHPNAIFRP